jgi:DNA replication protein DnaC
MELSHQVREQLKRLRLSGVVETLEARERQAIDGKWSYVDFLARLLEDELERRAQKQLALRVRRSSVNTTKTLEGFDFSFNPSIKRQQILALVSGEYVRLKRNVLICGPSGVGKPQPSYYLLWYERFLICLVVGSAVCSSTSALPHRTMCWQSPASARP